MDAPPLCMKSGPRLVSVPSKRGTTIKDAKKRLKQQTKPNETKAQVYEFFELWKNAPLKKY